MNANKFGRTVVGGLFLLLATSTTHAKDPQIRVGISYICPGTGSPTNQGPELGAIVAAVLADVGVQAAGALIDQISAYLSSPPPVSITNTGSLPAFLISNSAGVQFDNEVQCVWVVVADDFQQPTKDAYGKATNAQNPAPAAPTGASEAAANPSGASEAAPGAIPSTNLNYTQIQEFSGVKSEILMYFEGQISMSSDKSAWRIDPQAWYYPNFLQKANFLFQKKAHDIALTIQFASPGKESAPFATYSLAALNTESSALDLGEVSAKASKWLPLPTYTRAQGAVGEFFPINITGQLVETRKPNELATVLSKVAVDKKNALTTSLGNRIQLALSPGVQEQNQQQATTAAQTANTSYDTAYTNVKAARDTYNKSKAGADSAATTAAWNSWNASYATYQIAESQADAQMKAGGVAFKKIADQSIVPPNSP
ncbi:hypothetical protein SAMN05444172_8355 [Burkholderia sp. GAS332]|nr:hypothetical protein SAMN05444172_8355 [Burkholderia sp. GAS332]